MAYSSKTWYCSIDVGNPRKGGSIWLKTGLAPRRSLTGYGGRRWRGYWIGPRAILSGGGGSSTTQKRLWQTSRRPRVFGRCNQRHRRGLSLYRLRKRSWAIPAAPAAVPAAPPVAAGSAGGLCTGTGTGTRTRGGGRPAKRERGLFVSVNNARKPRVPRYRRRPGTAQEVVWAPLPCFLPVLVGAGRER